MILFYFVPAEALVTTFSGPNFLLPIPSSARQVVQAPRQATVGGFLRPFDHGNSETTPDLTHETTRKLTHPPARPPPFRPSPSSCPILYRPLSRRGLKIFHPEHHTNDFSSARIHLLRFVGCLTFRMYLCPEIPCAPYGVHVSSYFPRLSSEVGEFFCRTPKKHLPASDDPTDCRRRRSFDSSLILPNSCSAGFPPEETEPPHDIPAPSLPSRKLPSSAGPCLIPSRRLPLLPKPPLPRRQGAPPRTGRRARFVLLRWRCGPSSGKAEAFSGTRIP